MRVNPVLSTDGSKTGTVDSPSPLEICADRIIELTRVWNGQYADVEKEVAYRRDEHTKQILGHALLLYRQAELNLSAFDKFLKERNLLPTTRARGKSALGVIRFSFPEVQDRSTQALYKGCLLGLHQSLPESVTAEEVTAHLSEEGNGIRKQADAYRKRQKPKKSAAYLA